MAILGSSSSSSRFDSVIGVRRLKKSGCWCLCIPLGYYRIHERGGGGGDNGCQSNRQRAAGSRGQCDYMALHITRLEASPYGNSLRAEPGDRWPLSRRRLIGSRPSRARPVVDGLMKIDVCQFRTLLTRTGSGATSGCHIVFAGDKHMPVWRQAREGRASRWCRRRKTIRNI